ncbi:MAG: hypothetical protein AAB209_07155 [Bacteroidota bacterium]|mgnify:CR=1 FL=1
MLTKSELLETIEDMPDKFSIDQLMDRLIFIQKVERGLDQSRKVKSVSTAEAKRRLKKWLK